MNMVFTGKRALVIGGTGGIGGALSLSLANCGAELVIIGGSSKTRLDATINSIKKSGGTASGHLLKLDNVENAVTSILSLCPQTDILICAFGPFCRKPLADITVQDWQHFVGLNLILPGALTSAYLGKMAKQHWGRILLFGGTNTANIRGFTTTTPYSAAKTALGTVAKSVVKNADGVTCNVVCPGLTNTEYMNEEAIQYNKENAPGGNVLSVKEIADFAIEILKNPALNGGIFPIDYGIEINKV
ncbi:MAG: SDR family oxidoreductase [Bacteroidales bacterium]|nr:SDR family oxidoreductase [Bacteroidales bacterium]